MRRSLPARIALLSSAFLFLSLLSALIFRREMPVRAALSFKGVLTYHNNNMRTGRNSSEILLTLNNVNSTTFGKLFVIPTDGRVDAQPLYAPNVTIPGKGAHNVLFVATEHGTVYGFDADNGSTLWQVTTLAAGATFSGKTGCGPGSPAIGGSSSPVIDPTPGLSGATSVVELS